MKLKFFQKFRAESPWKMPFQHYNDPVSAAKEFLEENRKNFKIGRQRLGVFRVSLTIIVWSLVLYNVNTGSSLLVGYLFVILMLICAFVALERNKIASDNELVDQAQGIDMTPSDSDEKKHPLEGVLSELKEKIKTKKGQLLKEKLEQMAKELEEREKKMIDKEKIRQQKREEEEKRRKAKEREEEELREEKKRLEKIRTLMENGRYRHE